VFIASPLEDSQSDLVKLAKKTKKNNIAIDIINFGEEQTNQSKLEAFMEAFSSDESHLLTIPPGPHLLSDRLSPILVDEDGVQPPGMASGDEGFEFGIDPTLDPELALALRMSLEEEQARQAALQERIAREQGEGLDSVPEESERNEEDEDAQGGGDMHVDR
jgi:26S proteasome regulatory subunit N10